MITPVRVTIEAGELRLTFHGATAATVATRFLLAARRLVASYEVKLTQEGRTVAFSAGDDLSEGTAAFTEAVTGILGLGALSTAAEAEAMAATVTAEARFS